MMVGARKANYSGTRAGNGRTHRVGGLAKPDGLRVFYRSSDDFALICCPVCNCEVPSTLYGLPTLHRVGRNPKQMWDCRGGLNPNACQDIPEVKNLAAKIRRLRTEKGVSQKDLSLALGVHRATMWRVEGLHFVVSTTLYAKLQEFFKDELTIEH